MSANACGAIIMASWPEASVRRFQPGSLSVRRIKGPAHQRNYNPRPVHSMYVWQIGNSVLMGDMHRLNKCL